MAGSSWNEMLIFHSIPLSVSFGKWLGEFFLSRRGKLYAHGKGVNEDEEEHRVFPGRRRGHGRRRGGGDDGPPEQPPDREEADGPERPQAGRGGGPGHGQHDRRRALRRRGGEFPPRFSREKKEKISEKTS